VKARKPRHNPAAYELEQLTRYATILGDKSVFYFLPEGTDLTMLFGNNGLVPLQEAK
jgi:hypothetical protein